MHRNATEKCLSSTAARSGSRTPNKVDEALFGHDSEVNFAFTNSSRRSLFWPFKNLLSSIKRRIIGARALFSIQNRSSPIASRKRQISTRAGGAVWVRAGKWPFVYVNHGLPRATLKP